jgi:hypothetical protein
MESGNSHNGYEPNHCGDTERLIGHEQTYKASEDGADWRENRQDNISKISIENV